MATRQEVEAALDSERRYQDSLWPQDGGDGAPNPLTIGEFILMLEQYSVLARAEWIAEKKPEQKTLHVVRKLAGIALNALEQHSKTDRRQIYKLVADILARRQEPSLTIGDYLLNLEERIAAARNARSISALTVVLVCAVRCMEEHGAPLR